MDYIKGNINDKNIMFLGVMNSNSNITKIFLNKGYTYIDKFLSIDELLIKINDAKVGIIFNETLSGLYNDDRNIVISSCMERKLKIVNISSDINQALLFDYLIVVEGEQVIMEGCTSSVFYEEKILNRLGYKLPFYPELSIQLKYYGLVDKIYNNKEELVNKLWE